MCLAGLGAVPADVAERNRLDTVGAGVHGDAHCLEGRTGHRVDIGVSEPAPRQTARELGVLFGVGVTIYGVQQVSLRQAITPERLRILMLLAHELHADRQAVGGTAAVPGLRQPGGATK